VVLETNEKKNKLNRGCLPTQVKETRTIMNIIKRRLWDMKGHILRREEKFHHSTIEGAIGRRKPSRPRNS